MSRRTTPPGLAEHRASLTSSMAQHSARLNHWRADDRTARRAGAPSASTASALRVAGCLDGFRPELREWLLRHCQEPDHAAPLPPELECSRWCATDQIVINQHEAAVVRWQHVDSVCPGEAAAIANKLRAAGYVAVAFGQPDGMLSASLADLLGQPTAGDLSFGLRGHVYMVPHQSWCPGAAAAIEADICLELAAPAFSDWKLCGARLALWEMTDGEATA